MISAENHLGKRKMTRVPRNVRGKAECSEHVLRCSRERWCCKKSKGSGCCEHNSGVRTANVKGAGGDTHIAEESMVVRQYTLNWLYGKPSCGDI